MHHLSLIHFINNFFNLKCPLDPSNDFEVIALFILIMMNVLGYIQIFIPWMTYGRHVKSNYLSINSKYAWSIFESPNLIITIVIFLL